jgi:hypothetical protein
MGDRSVGGERLRDLAVAAATVATVARVSNPAGGDGDGKAGMPSVWETMGSWQVGESIHE